MYTPYEMCKIVNEKLSLNLPPQMFYQYTKKGLEQEMAGKVVINMIRSIEINGQRKINENEIERWITQYAKKKGIEYSSNIQLEIF
jgi:GH25 family lysozyme M1 (1,4-beta-N-acetylmuramidase)